MIPGSSLFSAPLASRCIPSADLPEPGVPRSRILFPRTKPPPRIVSNPEIPVGKRGALFFGAMLWIVDVIVEMAPALGVCTLADLLNINEANYYQPEIRNAHSCNC